MIQSNSERPGLGARLWGQPYLLLLGTVMLWAGNIVVGRAVRGEVPPVTVTLLRWTLALVVMAPFCWRRVLADRAALIAAWKPLLVLSLFGIAAYNALSYTGLQTTTVVNAGLLGASMTPFTVLFAFLFFRERPRRQVVTGMLISVLGALVVVSAGSLHTLLHFKLNRGDAFILAGLVSYSLYMVWLRRAPRVHPLSLLAGTFALGAVMLIPFALLEAAQGRVVHWGPTALLSIGYVSIFPSLIAYLMFNRGVGLIGAARASLFIYLIPVFSAAMAVAFLGERLHGYHWAGAALIGAGIVVASRRKAA